MVVLAKVDDHRTVKTRKCNPASSPSCIAMSSWRAGHHFGSRCAVEQFVLNSRIANDILAVAGIAYIFFLVTFIHLDSVGFQRSHVVIKFDPSI